tara:strand:+ start:255 stop:371 length:117 start_codon:yes stop_codon:yes gene_type:complete
VQNADASLSETGLDGSFTMHADDFYFTLNDFENSFAKQ